MKTIETIKNKNKKKKKISCTCIEPKTQSSIPANATN